MSKTHLTAIGRTTVSQPTKYLLGRNLIDGRTLDYGCGRGFDAKALGIESYDPYFQPDMPDGDFDTIICNYVLNVISDLTSRTIVVDLISRKLAPGGVAYISVRNDRKNLNGFTSRGTWQGLVVLTLPVVTSNANFTMYRLESSR